MEKSSRPRSASYEKRTIKRTPSDTGTNELVGSSELRKVRIATVKPFTSSTENGFRTDKYKTKNSAWTPVINPYWNNQIYQERIELIGHWFSMWTDAQRKKFLSFILKRCTKSQMKFVNEGWFKKQLPIFHLDFTTVLPRFISMYIFSLLDPRSMCRAAQVCWHWKFLSEQDEIWMAKCLRFGWFLPYSPSTREYGSWKHHYIMCTSTLDMEAPSKSKMAEMYGQFGVVPPDERNGIKRAEQKKTTKNTKDIIYYRQDTRRPPWLDTDPQPKDLDGARTALLQDFNPNQSISVDSIRAERLGLGTRPHQRSLTAPAHREVWAQHSKTSKRTRSASAEISVSAFETFGDEDYKEPISTSKLTLTEALALESGVDPSVVEQPWPNTIPTSPVRRKDLTVGVHPSSHDSVLESGRFSQEYRSDPSPAVIFISSEIPACEVLLASVLFGVIAIPYEYHCTTLDALLEKLKIALNGRQAKCIGFFAVGESGTIRLVKGHCVSQSSLHEPEMKYFWETVTTNVIHRTSGGHVDLFIPLTETESGMDLLVQLGMLTDMLLSCPTGITGSFSRVESEWLFVPNDVTPPALYFNISKFGAWSNMVDYLEECTSTVRARLDPLFSEEHKNLAKRFIGKVTFESFGLSHVDHLSSVASLLVEATEKLRKESSHYDKDELIGRLIEHLQAEKDGKRKPRPQRRKKLLDTTENVEEEELCASTEDSESDVEIVPVGSGKLSGEKRTLLAQKILSTEVAYMQSLAVLQEVFRPPLQAALASNRAILSKPNIKALFGDTESLLAISGLMVDELSKRLENNNWDSHQCLGDIFVKFTTQLRAYTNFLNNYPDTLATLQRCKEQNPQFRAFLERHERQPNSKMLSFAELLLVPGERLDSYIDLLQKFLRYTPGDHVDRRNITQAITKIQDIASIFKQYKDRLEREIFLQDLQKTIVNCPVLAEKSRRLVCSEDVSLLGSPNTEQDTKPEYRFYQHVGDVGLFLFNDSLVVAVLTYNNVPFKRLVKRSYKFQACVMLKKLKVQNVSDTRYIKNAFVLVSPKRMWICQANSWDQKLRWIGILENTIVAAINNRA